MLIILILGMVFGNLDVAMVGGYGLVGWFLVGMIFVAIRDANGW